jgi:alkanesulfonate monooxygenase SsuD/methylene tetrahydromethanopterin reductase-like flavin-dependent oxidoreductase (luciferase family)
VAEDAATLDLISSGRLTLGVGLGYVPTEFEMSGVAMDDRVRKLEDAMARTLGFEGHMKWAEAMP